MDAHIDVTPVTEPPYFQTYFDKGRRPSPDLRTATLSTPERRQLPSVSSTDTVVLKPREIARDESSLQTGEKQTRVLSSKPSNTQGSRSPLVAAREAKLALLAKKYEGEPTREDSARLALLTERIRRLHPRVTKHDIDVMTTVVSQVEDVTDTLAQLRNRLGIA